MAFPLTMGITDPPVIALTCLALALLARQRAARLMTARGAGTPCCGRSRPRRRVRDEVHGLAGAGHHRRHGRHPQRRALRGQVHGDGARGRRRAGGGARAGRAAPPGSILQNTVAYPLGLTSAKSPAQSPLPGHLIATLGSGGHLAALVLLAAAGLATVAWLVISPPATPAAAARRIAIGLTALFLLSPATRFGYFIYRSACTRGPFLRTGREPAADIAQRSTCRCPKPLRRPSSDETPAGRRRI